MSGVTTLFFDLGGVVLTNGWDRAQRREAVEVFDLDWEEFSDRHDMVSADFETGGLSLDDYLDRTVFYRARPFTRRSFTDHMRAQSMALPGMLDLLERLAETGRYFLATLNNESAELNRFRIHTFGLKRYFDAFFSSSSLGVKKPEKAIYDMALAITMRSPDESVFIDDRELNLQCAALGGMRTVLHRGADQLQSELRQLGVEI